MTYYPGPSGSANAQLPPWRRGRSDDRQTPLVFWLTMLALGGVSLVGMAWGASSVLAQKGSEKLLRVDLLLPKLKSMHWDPKAVAFHRSEPAPNAKAPPKDRNVIAPPTLGHTSVAVQEVPHALALALPAIVETCDEPVVYLNPCTPQRGDSPMMHNWKTLTMYSLLTAAAATFAPPPMLMAQDKTEIEKLTTDVQALTKSIKALTDRIGDLEKKSSSDSVLRSIVSEELKKLGDGKLTELGAGIKEVGTRVEEVKRDLSKLQGDQLAQKLQSDAQKIHIDFLLKQVENLNTKVLAAANGSQASPASPAVDKAFMEEMRSYMKKMEENSTAMKNLAEAVAKGSTTKTQTSMSPPINNGAAPAFGRLVFNNTYSQDLLLVVNGVNYRIPRLTRSTIENIPAGTVRYEVIHDGAGSLRAETVTLSAGGTHTLYTVNNP